MCIRIWIYLTSKCSGYRCKHVEHNLKTLSIYKYTINERGAKFRRLCVLCIFTQILIFERPQYALKLKKTHGSSGMHEPACMLAAAAAAAGRCWLLLLLLAAAQQQPAAAAATSSSQQPAAAASSSQQPAAEQQQPAWLLHGHAAASKPGCMVHGMLLLQNRDAWCMASCRFSSSSCCVHACVRAWLPA